MQLYYQPDFANDPVQHDSEAQHVKVLRLKVGDPIQVTDGQGAVFTASISKIDKSEVTTEITDHLTVERPLDIAVAIAPTKSSDRMEWFVEKCVELGISSIHFMQTRHSEKARIKLERMKKKAISAMKQSQKAFLPELTALDPFEAVLAFPYSQKFICHVDPSNPVHLQAAAQSGKSTCVFIGPEGDFTDEELTMALGKDCIKLALGTADSEQKQRV